MDKTQFIREQLARIPNVELMERQAKIRCPFHDDTNPSLDIALVEIPGKVAAGGFNCWACQTSGGWNKLAEKLGLDRWDAKKTEGTPYNAFAVLTQDLERRAESRQLSEYTKPPTEPWRGPWRGLTGEFLRRHGAESYWDRKASEYRIWLPIQDLRGRLIGHVAARLPGGSIPDKLKYLNSEDFPAKKIWYCLNYEPKPKTVIICEGPYDTLKFRFFGLPAIGQLGAGQVSPEKASQLIARGVERVVLAYDADDAGRTATPEAAKLFKSLGLDVTDLNLSRYLKEGQKKLDPGECEENSEVVQDLRAFLA